MQEERKAGGTRALEYSVEALDIHMCREWVLQRLHPHGAFCPGCHKRLTGDEVLDSFWEERRTYCRECGKRFTARTGTVINNTEMDMREIFLFCMLEELTVPNKKIAEILVIHQDSVKKWKKRLEEL